MSRPASFKNGLAKTAKGRTRRAGAGTPCCAACGLAPTFLPNNRSHQRLSAASSRAAQSVKFARKPSVDLHTTNRMTNATMTMTIHLSIGASGPSHSSPRGCEMLGGLGVVRESAERALPAPEPALPPPDPLPLRLAPAFEPEPEPPVPL